MGKVRGIGRFWTFPRGRGVLVLEGRAGCLVGVFMSEGPIKIAIVGPGAMGCLFASLLSGDGREVWILDHRPERAALINERGVTVESAGKERTSRVRASGDASEIGPCRLAIFCVKSGDTESAARSASPLVGPGTDALSLQNGLGNVEVLEAAFGDGRTLGGTTAQGANLIGPGRARHAGFGETVIGQPGGGVDRAEAAARIFRECGIETRVTDDLAGLIWSKLAINAAINPLTALLNVNNGFLAECPETLELMRLAAGEVKAVCDKEGIRLLFDDPFQKAAAVARATSANVSSMLQDVRAGRPTEIGRISGAAAERAKAAGLDAPVNRALYLLVKALERSYGGGGGKL